MKITREIVVFDAADLPAESAFWAGLLDGTVDAEDDWHTVSVDGKPAEGFQVYADPAGHPFCLCWG